MVPEKRRAGDLEVREVVDLRRSPMDDAVVAAAEVAVWALASELPDHRWAVLDRSGHLVAATDGGPEAWTSASEPVAEIQLEGEAGWLSVVTDIGVAHPSEQDQRIARAVARMLHSVVTTTDLRRRAEADAEEAWQVATVDPVTDVLNARGLWERLSSVPWSKPTSGDASVARVTVEDLHGINHQHGHQLGDQILKAVGQRLSGCLRSVDVVARLGGGDFVVIAHHIDAETLARRLREQVESIGVDVAIGVAHHERGEPIRTTVARADLDLRRLRDFWRTS